jgi:hypothetical protein
MRWVYVQIDIDRTKTICKKNSFRKRLQTP